MRHVTLLSFPGGGVKLFSKKSSARATNAISRSAMVFGSFYRLGVADFLS